MEDSTIIQNQQPRSRRRSVVGRRWSVVALREPAIAVGLLIVVLFAAAALLAPLLSPADPLAQKVVAGLRPPSAEYPLGSDKLRRDILRRLLYGARITL